MRLKLILGCLILVWLVKCVLNTPNIRIMEIGETTPFAGSSMNSKSTGKYFYPFSPEFKYVEKWRFIDVICLFVTKNGLFDQKIKNPNRQFLEFTIP